MANKDTKITKPANKPVKKPVKKRGNYFKGVWSELKKVNWPNRKELFTYTYVVVGAIVASAIFIYLADTVVAAILRVLV